MLFQYFVVVGLLVGVSWILGFAIPSYWVVLAEVVLGVIALVARGVEPWAWLVLASVLGPVTAAGIFSRRSLARPHADPRAAP